LAPAVPAGDFSCCFCSAFGEGAGFFSSFVGSWAWVAVAWGAAVAGLASVFGGVNGTVAGWAAG
jgi:hypothetical protein